MTLRRKRRQARRENSGTDTNSKTTTTSAGKNPNRVYVDRSQGINSETGRLNPGYAYEKGGLIYKIK